MSHRPRSRSVPVALAALVASWSLLVAACGDGSTGSTVDVATSVQGRAEPVSGRGSSSGDGGVDEAANGERTAPPTTASGTAEATTPTAGGTAAETDAGTDASADPGNGPVAAPVRTGAERLVADGLAPLVGSRVGLVANRASVVDGRRLIDVLDDHPEVELAALFAPEHGLGADDEAGAAVADGVDAATGVTIHSLYGIDRAPDPAVLAELDVVVFDLQDVGARFYTYTTTLGLVMQSAAEAGVPLLVLDRPNPAGGDRPDGQVRDAGLWSFVSPYPVPALHGLTVGELAYAIRGEAWLDGLEGLDLDVIELEGWDRSQRWDDTGLAWSPPSPGLPSAELSLLYPATVLLEATTLSFGRGTDRPFGQFGAPWLDAEAMVADLRTLGLDGVDFSTTSFVPDGATDPVPGVRLDLVDPARIRPMAVGVHVLARVLAQAGDRTVIDRPEFLDLLAGGPTLRTELVAGGDPAAVVAAWDDGLAAWESTRAPYLLYPSP